MDLKRLIQVCITIKGTKPPQFSQCFESEILENFCIHARERLLFWEFEK